MKSVAIFAKHDKEKVVKIGEPLVDWLEAQNLDIYFGDLTAEQISRPAKAILYDKIPKFIDLVIVLGGDGSILQTARKVLSYDTPVMAVNIGGLGFLTAFNPNEIYQQLSEILRGNYKVSPRSMLKVTHYRDDVILNNFTILNDVAVKKATLSRILGLVTYVDGELITTYLGDGLIISSPTGSTGYSLSANGPIISPRMKALVLTPICPHTLTHRPIVIGEEHSVEVRLMSSHSEVLLTLDGQIGFPFKFGDRVVVKNAPEQLRLIQNPSKSFFGVLRHKLKWGIR